MNTEKTIVYKTKALTGRIIILIFLILISSLILGVGFGYSLSQIVAREVTFVYVFLSLAVILAITQALINVFSFQLTRQYRMFLEDKTIEHILSLKHSTTLNVGETVGIVRLTTEEVSNEITSIIKGVFTILFTVIFSAIYAFLINPVVLLICVLFVVIVAFFNRKLTKKLPEMHDDLNLSVNSLMAVQWEFIKNREVGAWLNPAHVVSGYNNLTEFASKKLIKANKYEVLATLFSNYGSIIVVLIVAVIGGLLSERGLISAPELFALIILIPVIAGSLFNIPDQLNGFQRLKGGIATLDRLFSLEKHDIDCEAFDETINEIEVCDLSICFGEKVLLDNFSFKFEAGKFYVICGKSGSGKTSLLNILSKLVHSEKTVYINTHDLQNIASVDYWNSIAYVQQKSVMIDDTLDFNITLQRPLNAELLEKSKSLAGMPNSFSKSSGEIQKVCLARAFYTQAKVLLLDEITSSMDAKSEEYVIGSLKEYAHGNNAIVILVSHSEVIQNNADVLVTI